MPDMGWLSRIFGLKDDGSDTHGSPRVASGHSRGERPEAVAGPSWMSAEDWAKRLDAYVRQGRSAKDIRHVVAHLEARGPYTPRPHSEVVAWAKEQGIVSRQEYMPAEVEAEALTLGPDGRPDARLERVRDRLVVVTSRGWVNPKSRSAYKAGIHTVVTRGTSYHEAAVKAGRFTPGAPIRLVREPNNEHDPNAIAIYAERARRRSGYVPRGTAKRLAKLIDGGVDLVAISLRGAGTGTEGVNPQILICERTLFEHLTRDWPAS